MSWKHRVQEVITKFTKGWFLKKGYIPRLELLKSKGGDECEKSNKYKVRSVKAEASKPVKDCHQIWTPGTVLTGYLKDVKQDLGFPGPMGF